MGREKVGSLSSTQAKLPAFGIPDTRLDMKEKTNLKPALFVLGLLLMLAGGYLLYQNNVAAGVASFAGGLLAVTAAKRQGQK